MNIALMFRPVTVRLYVAYMCDAYYGGFDACEPGNTATRLFTENGHPYSKMWFGKIDKWYDVNGMYEMSDDEIIQQFNTWRSVGFNGTGTTKRTGLDLMAAKQRWETNGWTRYERKRNGRRTAARMMVVPTLACFGIVLPGE